MKSRQVYVFPYRPLKVLYFALFAPLSPFGGILRVGKKKKKEEENYGYGQSWLTHSLKPAIYA